MMTKKKDSKKSELKKQNYRDFLLQEQQEAKEAGQLGFMARALVQATMPHSKTDELIHYRKNGNFSIQMNGLTGYGLPYGTIPRMLMAYISTEAKKTKSRYISLGGSMSEFMAKLDMVPTGGRWGSIDRLRNQVTRLVTTSIVCVYDDNKQFASKSPNIVDSSALWWDKKNPEQKSIFESHLVLGEQFFNEVDSSSVPIDMRAIRLLSKSPMAIDVYCWLTHRMSYLRRPTVIPWEVLQMQFGSNYKRPRAFKEAFIKAATKVLTIYMDAKIAVLPSGLQLKPSSPHVKVIKEIK